MLEKWLLIRKCYRLSIPFKIDANNRVIDSFSMPLLPIVPLEDSELFFVLHEATELLGGGNYKLFGVNEDTSSSNGRKTESAQSPLAT